MSAQPATGHMTYQEDGEANRYTIHLDGDWLLSVLHNGRPLTERQEATLRRLVACWNACNGVSTEVIEAHNRPADLSWVPGIGEIIDQRDELLALLREGRNDLAIAASSWNEDDNQQVADFHRNRVLGLIKRVDAAIAKATGEKA